MTLREAMIGIFHEYGVDKTYWIAYSGGLDSQVLLALCHELSALLPLKLRVIHVNHGLSLQAKNWAKHCAQTCEQYQLDYIEATLQIKLTAGRSLEEVAREARYAVFAEHLQHDDILLTAHHQDDQAETVLMQLFRGAGLKGLAAMPFCKAFARGLHVRPLLAFSRAALAIYAQEQKLTWVDDESNDNTQLTRNFIRHEVMPLLKTRWPSISTTIARSAKHCAEAQLLLTEFAEQILATDVKANVLSVTKLLQLNPSQQGLLLRTWIQQSGFPLPDEKKLTAIREDVLLADWDCLPCVCWQKTELRRHRDHLYLMSPLSTHDNQQSYAWDLSTPLNISGVGTLHAKAQKGRGLCANSGTVTVCFRQGGETIDILNRGHHTLKNLFQEWQILPWLRDRIPLIFIDEVLVAVMGYFIDANYIAKHDEIGYEINLCV